MELYSNIIGEKGTPLLILHGLFGMSDNWRSLGKRFSEEKGFQVHLIDQRNHGRSPHTPDFSYALMAEDIKAYCEQHQLEDIILLGHSMGGKVAMHVAVKYPKLLQALIVVDIAPKSYPPHHDAILAGLAVLDKTELTSRNQADELLKEHIDNLGVRQFLLKNLYWEEKGKLALRINFPVLYEKYGEIGKEIGKGEKYEGPVFFIKGENSGYIKSGDRELIKSHFPKSQLMTIKDSDHWVHAEKPDEFFEGVTAFLKFNDIS